MYVHREIQIQDDIEIYSSYIQIYMLRISYIRINGDCLMGKPSINGGYILTLPLLIWQKANQETLIKIDEMSLGYKHQDHSISNGVCLKMVTVVCPQNGRIRGNIVQTSLFGYMSIVCSVKPIWANDGNLGKTLLQDSRLYMHVEFLY